MIPRPSRIACAIGGVNCVPSPVAMYDSSHITLMGVTTKTPNRFPNLSANDWSAATSPLRLPLSCPMKIEIKKDSDKPLKTKQNMATHNVGSFAGPKVAMSGQETFIQNKMLQPSFAGRKRVPKGTTRPPKTKEATKRMPMLCAVMAKRTNAKPNIQTRMHPPPALPKKIAARRHFVKRVCARNVLPMLHTRKVRAMSHLVGVSRFDAGGDTSGRRSAKPTNAMRNAATEMAKGTTMFSPPSACTTNAATTPKALKLESTPVIIAKLSAVDMSAQYEEAVANAAPDNPLRTLLTIHSSGMRAACPHEAQTALAAPKREIAASIFCRPNQPPPRPQKSCTSTPQDVEAITAKLSKLELSALTLLTLPPTM
mmetsp:Transcript_3694/g.10519  ORF Transcript_3694/g.10519 Transcript_3694/m.10519 type:complete len:369 (+) Transcript_3694:243-1349(+)